MRRKSQDGSLRSERVCAEPYLGGGVSQWAREEGQEEGAGREFSLKAACWNMLDRSLKPMGIFTTGSCSCACDFISDTMKSITNSTTLLDKIDASDSAHGKVVRNIES